LEKWNFSVFLTKDVPKTGMAENESCKLLLKELRIGD